MTRAAELRPERALVMRPRGLGDVVLSTAVLAALRLAWPEARLDYLSEASARSLLEADPRLERVFLLSPRRENAGRLVTGPVGDAIRWVRANRYDVVIDLFCNPRTAILTGLSGARLRVGYDWGARRIAYNVRVPRFGNPPGEHRYARDAMLDLLRDAGIHWEGPVTGGVHLEETDHAFAARALTELGYAADARFAAVLPGGSWESKRWTVAGFAEVGRALAEELGAPTLVVWGPPEQADALGIAAGLADRGRLAPPSTLREMAALLGRATLLVVTDCLGRHLAVLDGVPTVGIFGSTDPRDWTPGGGGHRTVRAPEGGARPLAELSPAAVLTEARALLTEILDAPRPEP